MEKIPKHIRMLAYNHTQKKDAVLFHLRCTCGNDTFQVAKGQSAAGKRANAEWEHYWKKYKWIPIFSFCSATEQKSGKQYIYGRSFLGIRIGKFYTDELHGKDFFLIKIACAKCQKEHVIFDSRVHGYDALAEREDAKRYASRSAFKTPEKEKISFRSLCKGQVCALKMMIRYSVPREELLDAFGVNMTEDTYANAFSWIEICAVIDGKEHLVWNFETA